MLRSLSALLLCSAAGIAADCESLAKLALPHTTIAEAAAVPAGDFKSQKNLPAFCRVAGSIAPSADSDIRFEVWLPAAGWNGKFLGVGNGGYRRGYQFRRHGGGHPQRLRHGIHRYGPHGQGRRRCQLGPRPSREGHRLRPPRHPRDDRQGQGHHRSFYGSAPKRSYFSSCSNGGRQALMEAQRYPADYDGIIAGAPANDWVHLMTNAARIMQRHAGAGVYIPAAKLPAIQAAALAACDRNDAVPDGVLENPAVPLRSFGVAVPGGGERSVPDGAAGPVAPRHLCRALRDGKGRQVYPGYALSGEAEPGGWGAWITGPAPEKSALFAFSTNFFKYMVYGDENWDYRKFDLARDLAAARKT
jgi:hypothetical protein